MAAVAALGLMAGGAEAAVTYTFNQTGANPAGRATITGNLRVSDDAFASGFSLLRSYSDSLMYPTVTSLAGLEAISITIANFGTQPRTIDLTTLFWSSTPNAGLSYRLSLSAAPNGELNGNIIYRTSANTLELTLTGGAFTGYGVPEIGGPCPTGPHVGFSNVCAFSGVTSIFQATPVPEPATLALFGMGLLGLAAACRRA